MIYSKQLQTYKPISVKKDVYSIGGFGLFTKYTVKDGNIPVGYIDLKDTDNGVFVEMIQNNYPDLYSGFGKVADQIEVEHCLNRDLKHFEIRSNAGLNSHALHYLRGKRFARITDSKKAQKLLSLFKSTNVNQIVESIINNTPKGKKYITDEIGSVPMYMPRKLIEHYIEIIKKSPIIHK